MLQVFRKLALVLLVGFVLPLTVASIASAREFTGLIDKINEKKMIVDNRQGDKVPFNRTKGMVVDDQSGGDKQKSNWTDLKSGDHVSVEWKMMDKPRKAYKIIVLPPKAEAGEDL